MNSVEQPAADIYMLEETTRENWFASVIVVLGKAGIGLVDSGYEHTPDRYILPFLADQRRDPKEVTLVVNTHGDGDHALGNRRIKELTGAPIAAHEAEFDDIAVVDRKLVDGEKVKLGDRKFTVIHCPGHRPGNVCLYDAADRLILTGDTVVGTRENLIRMGPEPYIESLGKLLELDIEVMCMSHPFQPAGKAVLNGEEADRMIRESMAIANKLL
jgi:glyoxylase-like metal-dependent hydrolase (beta-lactamase superfamily II)